MSVSVGPVAFNRHGIPRPQRPVCPVILSRRNSTKKWTNNENNKEKIYVKQHHFSVVAGFLSRFVQGKCGSCKERHFSCPPTLSFEIRSIDVDHFIWIVEWKLLLKLFDFNGFHSQGVERSSIQIWKYYIDIPYFILIIKVSRNDAMMLVTIFKMTFEMV